MGVSGKPPCLSLIGNKTRYLAYVYCLFAEMSVPWSVDYLAYIRSSDITCESPMSGAYKYGDGYETIN